MERLAERVLKIRERVQAGQLDLRDVGEILEGKWDQELPSALLDAALAAGRKPRETPSHGEAMDMICSAASLATLSYEEAIAVYLRVRGILKDGETMLGAPVPMEWTP